MRPSQYYISCTVHFLTSNPNLLIKTKLLFCLGITLNPASHDFYGLLILSAFDIKKPILRIIWTQIRLLLWKQSDQVSYCLLSWKKLVWSAPEYMQQTLKADKIFRTKIWKWDRGLKCSVTSQWSVTIIHCS